ncbi:DNA replication complex GINS protein Sld5 [Arctopsyche grandis]|uniref:DNA replication complex GINS protein Sld5 n=1 Tax=Arctopsyche grandis TaxID=121162 RepID=UPI00406D8936
MENGHSASFSDDEEPITADIVLKTLESAWLNEKFSPEILPHQNDMVECMLGQIQHMETNINKLPKTDFRLPVHKMELCRIKYIISSYLRTRLEKIERYTLQILKEERQRMASDTNYLTPAEYQYASSYIENLKSYLTTTALNNMPDNMHSFEDDKMTINPNMNAHVFFKANETVNGVVLEGLGEDQDEEIDLEAGSQHILPYKYIADLVKNGKVQLI